MSSANSSIEELKAKGYPKFKARVRKADQILEQQEETAKSEDDQPKQFWKADQLTNNHKEFQSPICFEKGTHNRLTEFSMMLHKNTNTSTKDRIAKSCASKQDLQQIVSDDQDKECDDDRGPFCQDEQGSCSQFNQKKPRTMTEFNLPDSTNSFCGDNESELCRSSKNDDEVLFNETNIKGLGSKIGNADSSALSTMYSSNTVPTQRKLLSTIGSGSQAPLKQSMAQQVDTDDQSELDEIAALQKQRQKQKKKNRRKNKKKDQQQVQNNQEKPCTFDIELCQTVCEQIERNEGSQDESNYRHLITQLTERILDNTIEDQFMQNNVIDFL